MQKIWRTREVVTYDDAMPKTGHIAAGGVSLPSRGVKEVHREIIAQSHVCQTKYHVQLTNTSLVTNDEQSFNH